MCPSGLSILPSIHLSIHSSILPSIPPSVCPSILSVTNITICVSIHPSIQLSIYLSIHPSIHLSFTHSWPTIIFCFPYRNLSVINKTLLYSDTYFVQPNKSSSTNVVLFQVLHTGLCCFHSITYYMIQSTTCRADSYIILVIYCSKITLQQKITKSWSMP